MSCHQVIGSMDFQHNRSCANGIHRIAIMIFPAQEEEKRRGFTCDQPSYAPLTSPLPLDLYLNYAGGLRKNSKLMVEAIKTAIAKTSGC